MEYGYQFDFIDSTSDFGKYRLLILPDVIPVDEILGRKLSAYINAGGKLLDKLSVWSLTKITRNL